MRAAYVIFTLVVGCTVGTIPAGSDGSVTPADAGAASCAPGRVVCHESTRFRCGDDGHTRLEVTECPDACDPTLGCVTCVPNARRCDGERSLVCTPDASGWRLARDCADWSTACGDDGYCEDACAASERAGSNVGCEYWAVPLPNTAREGGHFALMATNDGDARAMVRVLDRGVEIAVERVDVGETRLIAVPYRDELRRARPSSRVEVLGAYRVVSDQPIVLAQFNPLEYTLSAGEHTYSSDASLLLPTHALGTRYTALSYVPLSGGVTHRGGGSAPGWFALDGAGYLAVVGATREPTVVRIRPRAPVRLTTDGVTRDVPADQTFEMRLREGEVALVVSAPPPRCDGTRPGYTVSEEVCVDAANPRFEPYCRVTEACREVAYDLTGTRVEADHPVAVFGAHECAFVPYDRWACDHLEEQLMPDSRLGRTFATTAIGVGGEAPPNLLRVVASRDDTEVQIEPAVDGVSRVTLAAGEHVELEIQAAVRVSANAPVAVAQYLIGQGLIGQGLIGQGLNAPDESQGDPSMLTVVPREQFRDRYVISLPESYRPEENGQSYLLITRTSNHPIVLDGEPLDLQLHAVGDLEVGVVAVAGGPHAIEAEQPFGVSMFGVGTYTSYAAVAGLGLVPLLE